MIAGERKQTADDGPVKLSRNNIGVWRPDEVRSRQTQQQKLRDFVPSSPLRHKLIASPRKQHVCCPAAQRTSHRDQSRQNPTCHLEPCQLQLSSRMLVSSVLVRNLNDLKAMAYSRLLRSCCWNG